MPACPTCRRPVALARARCLYCGAELPADLVAERVPSAHPIGRDGALAEDRPSETLRPRVLLVVEVGSAVAETLARALGVSSYEAALLVRRGGPHLHGVFDEDAGWRELDRLRDEGLTVKPIPESEVRIRPLRALGGEQEGGRLWLRTEEGDVTVGGDELLLVVRGPIARQYQPSHRARRFGTTILEEGYRVHLHRRFAPRPVEIDAANFEFGFAVTGSARLEIDAWVDAVAQGVPRDDGFRWLPPAFGVAEPEPKTALAAASRLALATRGSEDAGESETLVLDNAAQFRFYSAWRAALERRRAAGPSV